MSHTVGSAPTDHTIWSCSWDNRSGRGKLRARARAREREREIERERERKREKELQRDMRTGKTQQPRMLQYSSLPRFRRFEGTPESKKKKNRKSLFKQ